MGLGNAVHWVSWFIDSISVMFISCVLLTIILVVSILEHLTTLKYFTQNTRSACFNEIFTVIFSSIKLIF